MKTLITGATGFLGTHLVRQLAADGQAGSLRVFAQSRRESLHALGVEVVTGSVTDPAAVARAVAGVNRIYHLAGFVSRKPEDAARMYAVHVEGTRLLCEAAREAGVERIVLSSTSGTIAVSDRADDKPDETSAPPLNLIGRWPYYASKYYQEETARRGCGDAVELVMVNPSLLLGPGDDRLSSTRDVLQFLSGEIKICPSGGLNFVDVRDVAAALPAAMERGRPGERYLLGGYNWTFAEFFNRLARQTKLPAPLLKAPRGKLSVYAVELQAALYRKLGRTPPLEPSAVEMAGYFWYFDSTRARDELGFEARESADTLRDTVTYLRDQVIGRRPLTGRAGPESAVAAPPGA
jgi:dihydroflavonol-4-reductase